jgi:copper oxidase (laccase) domain-containing protein
VGAEVRAAFVQTDPGAAACFRPHAEGKFLADLPALARRRLAALGIASIHGNDGSTQWCTVANASRFFSHRRDRVSGRFAAAIWLD